MITSLLLLASATSIPVDVGHFDASQFPDARRVERRLPHAEMNERVERILAKRECQLPGQTADRFDVAIPYAVLMEPTGAAKRVVIKDIGCAPIETLTGELALDLVRSGALKADQGSGDRWYVSEANFTQGGEQLVHSTSNPDKVVCRQAEPKLGSRIATKRVCMTTAQWRAYYMDREQMVRDIQNSGTGRDSVGCFSKSAMPSGC